MNTTETEVESCAEMKVGTVRVGVGEVPCVVDDFVDE